MRDGGVTVPEARIGTMLAGVLDGWEDRGTVRWHLGKKAGSGGAGGTSLGIVWDCFDNAQCAVRLIPRSYAPLSKRLVVRFSESFRITPQWGIRDG